MQERLSFDFSIYFVQQLPIDTYGDTSFWVLIPRHYQGKYSLLFWMNKACEVYQIKHAAYLQIMNNTMIEMLVWAAYFWWYHGRRNYLSFSFDFFKAEWDTNNHK